MPTYRVYYKGYYHEYSEFEHEDVEAADELSALREFFKQKRSELREAELLEGAGLPRLARLNVAGEYRWWEGDWLQVYRGIQQVDVEQCPLCSGTGEVAGAVARQFAGEPA